MRAAARGSWRTRASATLPIVALALACESGTSATDEGETDGHETGEVDTDAAGPEDAPAGCELETPGPRPRLVRLTHAQYDSTVRDLLPGVDMWPSSQFIADPLHGGFDNNAAALSVTSRLARDYRRAAEEVAARAVERPHTLRAYAACLEAAGDPLELSEAAGESCARELIAAIGRRVYRRPLSDAQRQAYLERYRAGAGLYEDGAPFAQGVRLVLETMLQSPRFLYRVELSDDVAAGGDAIALDGYELATRLSYLLWNSTPDDALLDAAEAGALADAAGVEAEARRLLADPRAAGPVADFHAQWLRWSRYDDLAKDPALYPEFAALDGDALREETRRFIEHVVFELEEGYPTLMTAPLSFVDARLAAIYGVDRGAEDPAAFVRVSLDPGARAGLLTQIGFLAAHAYPDGSSPIHRGVFVHEQLLCNELPPPPDNASLELPPASSALETTRERVEAHTAAPQCAGCHGLINPAGFAFEHLDGIGRYRAREGEAPIDSAAALPVDGALLEFDDHVELAHQLADLEQARRCYLRNWFRYAYAREPAEADQCTLEALHARAELDDYGVQELLVALTQTRTFRFRAPDGSSP